MDLDGIEWMPLGFAAVVPVPVPVAGSLSPHLPQLRRPRRRSRHFAPGHRPRRASAESALDSSPPLLSDTSSSSPPPDRRQSDIESAASLSNRGDSSDGSPFFEQLSSPSQASNQSFGSAIPSTPSSVSLESPPPPSLHQLHLPPLHSVASSHRHHHHQPANLPRLLHPPFTAAGSDGPFFDTTRSRPAHGRALLHRELLRHERNRGARRVDQIRASPRRSMAQPLDEAGPSRPRGHDYDDEDELIEIEFGSDIDRQRRERRRARHHHSQAASLFVDPQPANRQTNPPHRFGRSQSERQPQQQPEIIDLTDEPEEPISLHHQPPQPPGRQPSLALPVLPDSPRHRPAPVPPAAPRGFAPPRNPRRQMSLNHRTPSLARSDGSILGAGGAPVIDLTMDSPDDAPPAAPAPAPNNARGGHQRSPSQELTILGVLARFNEVEAVNRFQQALPEFFRGIMNRSQVRPPHNVEFEVMGEQGMGPLPLPLPNLGVNPLQFNEPILNYRGNGFGRARPPTPQPIHFTPPAAREGFSRNTGEGVVAICASCDEALEHDPEAAKDDEGQPPAKRSKTRVDTKEQYFWVADPCGHVYCKRCYENRRNPLIKRDNGIKVGFEVHGKKIWCAVEDCETDVTSKSSWMGIFM